MDLQRDQRFLHYVNVSAGLTNCLTVYYLFTFLERADVYGFKRSFTFIGLFDKLFYPAFCVFRTRNVYVLVVFRRRLSVCSTNYCSSYSLLCFSNEECLRLCISCFFAGVYRSVRQTVLPGILCFQNEESGAQPGEGSRGSGTPLLCYENEYYLKRKNVWEPPFRNSARRDFRL